MRAIRIHEFGGPEVLKLEAVPDVSAGPGEALVAIEAAGVNFIDIYHRTGLYANPLPLTPGMEGAGRVVALGDGVTEVAFGDRVAWATQMGAYASLAAVPASKLVAVPAGVALPDAAALMLQGLTAHYLARDTFPLKAGHTAVIHAAAGGVGLLLTQLAKLAGARVLAVVGQASKVGLSRQAGADEVLVIGQAVDTAGASEAPAPTRVIPPDHLAATVKALTGGSGADVVYDSVGRDTYLQSMASLRPRGMLVLFGNASGAVPAIEPLALAAAGSIYLTRPTLAHYTADSRELRSRAGELFDLMAGNRLRVRIDRTWPLAQAAEAHRALASRQTMGKLILKVVTPDEP